MRTLVKVGDRETLLEVTRRAPGRCVVRLGADREPIEAKVDGGTVVIREGGRAVEAVVSRRNGPAGAAERLYTVTIAGRLYEVRLADPLRAGSGAAAPRRDGPAEVRAIMPGKVVTLLVAAGDAVKSGQGIVVIEAMKMENEIPAPRDGRLGVLRVKPGDTVEAGTPLFTVE